LVQIRPVLFVLGLVLGVFGLAMLVPMAFDLDHGHPDWRAFGGGAAITLFAAGLFMAGGWIGQRPRFTAREGFLLTGVSWVTVASFGSLPLMMGELGLSFSDAFFETASGLTTTGATLLTRLDRLSRGLLLWRAMLQGIGGIGIIVMVVALFPYLRVGGMQLFRSEFSEKIEKPLPRAAQIAGATVLVYVFLLAACGAAYWALGMSLFDAATHAMTTVATAGFANYDDSFAAFKSPALEWTAVLFMSLSALPLFLFVRAARREWRHIWRDTQVRWFLITAGTAVIAVSLWLWLARDTAPGDALRLAAFNVVSLATTTGYASADYSQWGSFAAIVFLALMFIGGCTGSTAGAVKVLRFEIMAKLAVASMRQLVQRHGVHRLLYQRRPLGEDIVSSIMVFGFVYFVSFGVLALSLGALGLDFTTAVSGAAAAVGNIGPGLGEIIGPAGNYATLPDPAKWLLAIGMIMGRLEFMAVLVLFTRRFWRG
jgi:trk system potassium uptake protein TrkH